MKKEYDFSEARRITPREVEENRKGIEALTGKKRPKRPGPAPKAANKKYHPIAIRLHPRVLEWAKKEGEKRGVGYQTIINDTLLRRAG